MMRLDSHPMYAERDMLKRVLRKNFGVRVAATGTAWLALRVGAIVGESFGSTDPKTFYWAREELRRKGFPISAISRVALRTRHGMPIADVAVACDGYPDWVQHETFSPHTSYRIELDDVVVVLRGLEYRTRTIK